MTDINQIRAWIAQGEGINVEFKASQNSLSRSAFESVCAMLNRNGGHILLGVTDDGKIEGVSEASLQQQLDTFAKDMNNPQILSPTYFLYPEVVAMDGKSIICVNVPESVQVHSYKGVIYDRREEGDVRLTNYQLIANLYIRKQKGYTEDIVLPQLRIDDFDGDTLSFVRQTVRANRADHPWLNMTNAEMLQSARMFLRDESGREGYTMAAALLFGKPNTIASVLPHYKTDAIFRHVSDMILYDDREVLTCNLINTYQKLMDFCRRHINEYPLIERNRRMSLREAVMREIVGNLCIHREYSNAYPATLEITPISVTTRNWNLPHVHGIVSVEKLQPFPKNPIIASMFREMGWAEELGAGMRNLRKYAPLISGNERAMEITDADIFTLTLPLSPQKTTPIEVETTPKTTPFDKKTTPIEAEPTPKTTPFDKKTTPIEAGATPETTPMGRNNTQKTSAKVIEYLKSHPSASIMDLSKELGLTIDGARWQVRKLKREGCLQRQGNNRSGRWIVTNRPHS